VLSPNRGTTSSVLRSVSCVSPSWCAAVGVSYLPVRPSQTLVELWNGKSWRIAPSPSRANELVSLAAVDCVSSTWCIAVGGDETGALIERWDGRTWTMVAHPTALEEGASFGGVSCVSSAACVAVGGGPGGALTESWNGHAW
jgi:hypothetical protein